MNCDGTDCDGCAVCDTLTMGPFPEWEPKAFPAGTIGACVFCRKVDQLAYYTALGMSVGVCCAISLR
jgi:hypothetical protein